MVEPSNSFGYWLRRRRKALDLTQAALAQKVCCSPAAIKKIEAEERRPSKALAQRLAEQLAIPAHERAAFLAAARSQRATGLLTFDAGQVEEITAPATIDARARARVPPDRADDQKLPFVGRNIEYGQFLGLIARLTARSGQVVLIEGEAGIGKSRLMTEVACYARQQALPLLVTNCYEIERAMAYQLVIDLATQACAAAPEVRLRMMPPILLAEIVALVPAMAARLVDLPILSVDFPEARQARLFHALVQLLDALAQDRQLIVMIDDVQWADDASLRFLHFLARQIVGRPVLLACAYRDEEMDGNASLSRLVESLRLEAGLEGRAHPMRAAQSA